MLNIPVESIERVAAQLIIDHNRLQDLLGNVDSKALVESGFKLYEELGEIVVDVLAKLIGHSELLHDVHQEITRNNPSSKKLLKETKIQIVLAGLQNTLGTDEQRTNLVRQLWNISQDLDYWPRFWSIIRPLDSQEIQNCLNLLELRANPFGPEQAELDSDLKDYYYISSEYESSLRGNRPVIVFGDVGMGKTALAFIVSYWCMNPASSPKEPASFPVYMNLHPEDLGKTTTLDRIADILATSVGETLLRFLALNPYRFLEHDRASKASITTTLIHTTGSYDNLINRLQQAGLSDHDVAHRFVEELRKFSADQDRAKRSHRDWFDILGKSRPADFCITYLLIDMHSQGLAPENMPQIATRLNRLVQQIIPLASLGVYVKLFLPASLRSHLISTISPGIHHFALEWSNGQIKEMLRARLGWASSSYQTEAKPVSINSILELNQLFDKPSRSAKPSPEEQFIKAVQGSPRLLIRLGNILLLKHAKEQPDEQFLTSADLRSLLNDSK